METIEGIVNHMIGYEDIKVGSTVICPATGEEFKVTAVHPQSLSVISNTYGGHGVLDRYQFLEGHFQQVAK